MIGVIADPADHLVVREFFELFKTPWEFYSTDHNYDAVLCAGDFEVGGNAKVVIRYAGRNIRFDDDADDAARGAGAHHDEIGLDCFGHYVSLHPVAAGDGRQLSIFLCAGRKSWVAGLHRP